MSVFKRAGSPYYYAEVIIQGHRVVRSTRTTTEREARAVERRLRAEWRERVREPQRIELTVDAACGRY
jgi:hypothetical protein